MARTNACSEITRFWLQARHGCLVDEGVPVPVPYGQSDIDIVAIRPDGSTFELPNGMAVGPCVIVETKDEHDWDPSGRGFWARLRADWELMRDGVAIPSRTKGVKFTMLREEHFVKATTIFGNSDFDRIFVMHALDETIGRELAPRLVDHRIYLTTTREVVSDLVAWYRTHPRPSGLRHSPTGDLFHLLVGFCGLGLPTR
jgi:hypothetical protein